jgi:hypothetical protein
VQLWKHPEHAAFLQQPYSSVDANPVLEQLLQQSLEHLLQLTPAAFEELYAQDVLHHCSGSATMFADASIAGTLSRIAVWLQQQPESTLGLLHESQSDTDTDEEGSEVDADDCQGAAPEAAADKAARDLQLPLSVQLWYLCNKQLGQITWQLFMAMGRDGDKAVTSITQQLVESGKHTLASSVQPVCIRSIGLCCYAQQLTLAVQFLCHITSNAA